MPYTKPTEEYMKYELPEIKDIIERGEIEKAISTLDSYISNPDNISKDEAFYMLGNLYRKKGNWQLALNNYLEAIELNPNSPAVNARDMLMDILNFYNKDMFNQ